MQQEEEANDDEKDAESDGNATDDGYGEFGARGVHKRLRKWTQSELKSCRKLRMQFLQALVDEMDTTEFVFQAVPSFIMMMVSVGATSPEYILETEYTRPVYLELPDK